MKPFTSRFGISSYRFRIDFLDFIPETKSFNDIMELCASKEYTRDM